MFADDTFVADRAKDAINGRGFFDWRIGQYVPADLFLYGGIIVSEKEAVKIIDYVDSIKEKHGVPIEVPIKWNFTKFLEKWQQLSPETWPEIQTDRLNRTKLYSKWQSIHKVIKEKIIDCFIQLKNAYIVLIIVPLNFYKLSYFQCYENLVTRIAKKLNILLKKRAELGILFLDQFPTIIPQQNKIYRKTDYINKKNLKQRIYSIITHLRRSDTRWPSSCILEIIPGVETNLGISRLGQVNDIILGVVQYYFQTYVNLHLYNLQQATRQRELSKKIFSKILPKFLTQFTSTKQGFPILNAGLTIIPGKSKNRETGKFERKPTILGRYCNEIENLLKVDFHVY